MASWKEERDRLVAQTLAFVQHVAAAHPGTAKKLGIAAPTATVNAEAAEASTPIEITEIPVADIGSTDALANEAEADTLAPPINNIIDDLPARPQIYATTSERAEIVRRVASFKARQQTLNRDREAYYEAMRARIRTSLGNGSDDKRL